MQTAVAQQARNHDVEIDATGSNRYFIQSAAGPTTLSSPAFTQLTLGNITTTRAGILVATFTAESRCTASTYCSIRILCDGVELQPVVGTNFAFNSPGGSTWKSLSVTRHTEVVPAGTYSCQVQSARVGGSGSHVLDDWTFEVEFRRVP
jgi:hypothetical protein